MALQKKYRFLFFFSMLAIGSCMSDAEYTDFRTVAKTGLEEPVVFELNNALDTKKPITFISIYAMIIRMHIQIFF